MIGGTAGGEGIAGVEGIVVALEIDLAMELVRTGLGENLSASVAETIVFGGEGILVDANFEDRRFRRQLAAAESINIDFAAVGSGGRASQCGEFVGQLVGIVRERAEVVALEDDGCRDASGFDVDFRRTSSPAGDDYMSLLRDGDAASS